MKLKLVVLSLALVPAQILLAEVTRCECDVVSDDGSYKNKYSYHVGEGQGCCSGTVSQHGTNELFVLNEGVWQWVSGEQISGQTAQQTCCEPS
jgi:hypothetical protein